MARSPDYKEKADEAQPAIRTAPGAPLTPVLEPNEARQGVTHHYVRVVLAVSLGVAVLIMAVVYFAFFSGPTPG